MDTNHFKNHSLTALAVFEHTINKDLIRTLHVYRFENGKENEVEREFVFKNKGSYEETKPDTLLTLQGLKPSEMVEGRLIGLWLCIFSFHAHRLSRFSCIPSLLSLSRNSKLKSIPTLADDLQIISKLSSEGNEPSLALSGESHSYSGESLHERKRSPFLVQDLNCLPDSVDDTSESLESGEKTEHTEPGTTVKKKRAAPEDIARIGLEDLAKYFDLPIAEASRNLNIGLTVLKKKCRELGIARWPHRKIKSLESLIRDLEAEGKQQATKSNAAVMAVTTRRQKMLEREKENMERKPFMEIQSDTKRFRQNVFKKRYKAKALKKQGEISTSSVVNEL